MYYYYSWIFAFRPKIAKRFFCQLACDFNFETGFRRLLIARNRLHAWLTFLGGSEKSPYRRLELHEPRDCMAGSFSCSAGCQPGAADAAGLAS
jgi:hypothetical protein